MQIDWVTVVAQILNFLVLVWLLNRVLYRPVMGALRQRSADIAARLERAETAEADAEAEKARLAAERREIDETRTELIAEAREEAEVERGRLVKEAREDVAARRRAWVADLEAEREDFLARLRARAARAFGRLARRALADLADADLADRVGAVFARRLEEADEATRDDLREAAGQGHAPRLTLAARPSGTTAGRLREAAAALFDGSAEIRVVTDPDLVCGAVLEVGSRRLAWTLDSYLDALEADLAEALDAPGEQARAAATEAAC